MAKTKLYLLGAWSDYFSNSPDSVYDRSIYRNPVGSIEPYLDYLKNGEVIIKEGYKVNCAMCPARLEQLKVYSDGIFFWTAQYIHHVEKHDYPLDPKLVERILSKNFIPTTRMDFDYSESSFNDLVNQIKQWLIY